MYTKEWIIYKVWMKTNSMTNIFVINTFYCTNFCYRVFMK